MLPTGWAQSVRVEITTGLISRVECGAAPPHEDERHKTALPGLATVHSHGFQRGMAGLAEYRGAGVGMFESGFTHLGEFHYLHNDTSGARYANDELRALEYRQRLAHQARNVIICHQRPSVGNRFFNAALSGGAQSLGIASGTAAGMRADIISLNIDHPALCERAGDQLLDSWIFASNQNCIDAVCRHGRKLVTQGRHIAAEPIKTRYTQAVKRILQQ